MDEQKKQFDFGENWDEFSRKALNPERVRQARDDFSKLLEGTELQGRSFVDIGFGQGLSLLAATASGAFTVGCDINPKCKEVLDANRRCFPEAEAACIPVITGSILDDAVLNNIRATVPGGQFDIVHSWGVLHHTGNMKKAIVNAASLVKPGGRFVLAIYNRHWTSPVWFIIKWFYNMMPKFVRKIMILIFYPVIWLAKYAVTKDDPKKQARGMDFYYNVIDWVGGYPYEYASLDKIEKMLAGLGFAPVKKIPAQVPTGCNEFVFEKL